MAAINPAPAALGLASPVLGPWFGDNTVNLAAPGPRLSVALTFNQDTTWLPPAIGTLTMQVARATRPPRLAGLTDALGAAAFTDGALVAMFQLLPEVEERLEVLTGMLPRPDGVAVTRPVAPTVRTRARVRALAIEFTGANPSLLDAFVNPLNTGSDPAAFGLVTGDDGKLTNGPLPMSDLRRPEKLPLISVPPLANFKSGTAVTMWAFDAEGLPIDPGAVATWWAAIGGGNVAPFAGAPNIWADAGNKRTCQASAGLVFRLVNPHRGVLDSRISGRVRRPPNNATAINASANPDLFTASATAGASAIAFTKAGTPDEAPVPLAALLPLGNYRGALNLWANGPLNVAVQGGGAPIALARDYVEVAVVDVESFLVGTPRTGATPATTPADRRASAQNRASTRVNVSRTQVVLQPTIDLVAAAFTALPNGTNPVSMLTTAYDHDWGSIALNLPGGGQLPNVLPPLAAFALQGGGTADGQTIGPQQIVVRLTLPGSTALGNAWVRIYPQKIDPVSGRREAQPGGAGRFGTAAASGATTVAHVVVTLPEGRLDGSAQMGVDVLIFDGTNPPRVYADQRVTRPQPIGGAPVELASVNPADLLLACELGSEFNPTGVPNGAIPSGSTLVARHPASGSTGERFQLIDRSTVPLAWFDAKTMARTLRASDTIAVTTPAFVDEPRGDTDPNDSATTVGLNPTITMQGRNGISSLTTAGAPLPAMERLELVGLRSAGAGAGAQNVAVVGSAPALAAMHEIPPIQAGNPDAPGGREIHGAGVQLTGGAITDVADFVRDRLFPASGDLVSDAATNALPAQAVNAPAQWAAVLKTVARGVEGEPGLFEGFALDDDDLFATYDTIAAALPNLPAAGTLGNVNAALRAIGRRIVNALGRQEALFALIAALARAERLVYIETPAIDNEAIDADGADVTWLTTLTARLTARPALRVALCVPRELLPGTPIPLKWVRNELWHRTLDQLLTAAGDRVVVFSPGAGPFSAPRFASTVVVVDDVWALVGSTHLWRRGLSFDSSLAVAVFDEVNTFSVGAAIRAFRVQLAADRLGLAAPQVPLAGREFFESLQRLVAGGGNGRLALGSIARAPAVDRPSETDLKLWNRDGSISGDADLLPWLDTITQFVTR